MALPRALLFFHLARHQNKIQANCAGFFMGYSPAAFDDDNLHLVFWQSVGHTLAGPPLPGLRIFWIAAVEFVFNWPE